MVDHKRLEARVKSLEDLSNITKSALGDHERKIQDLEANVTALREGIDGIDIPAPVAQQSSKPDKLGPEVARLEAIIADLKSDIKRRAL